MRLWVYDMSWAGAIIVVAETEDEAQQLVRARLSSEEPDFQQEDDLALDSFDLTPGFKMQTSGDA